MSSWTPKTKKRFQDQKEGLEKQILFSTNNKIKGVGYVLGPGHCCQEILQESICRHRNSRANTTTNLCSHLSPLDSQPRPVEWALRNQVLRSQGAHAPQSVHRVRGRVHAIELQMSPKNTILALKTEIA